MSGRRRNLQAAGRVERASERVGVLPRNGELLRGSVQGPDAACGEARVRQRGLRKVGHHGHHCTANNKCATQRHKFIICNKAINIFVYYQNWAVFLLFFKQNIFPFVLRLSFCLNCYCNNVTSLENITCIIFFYFFCDIFLQKNAVMNSNKDGTCNLILMKGAQTLFLMKCSCCVAF